MIAEKWASLSIRYGSATRINFYEGFQNLVENGLSVGESLKELYKVWSSDGKKPETPLAMITRDLLIQLSNGTSLSRALARWVPFEEASLLAAGEQKGRLVEAFNDVVRVITAKQEINSAIFKAVMYPMFLCLPLGVLLWIISSKLVPRMARTSDPESWTGGAYLLYRLADFLMSYGIALVLLLIAAAILVVASLPRLTGRARILLDRGPFYSTYRMIHGSTFLLNLSVMMRANIGIYGSLEILREYANPWMKERIDGALYGIRLGTNLGVALENAGHHFPDKKAIQFIRILAEREGFSESIHRYSQRWLTTSIKRVQRLAVVSLTSMLLLIGGVQALVVIGTQGMQSSFEQSASRAQSHIK
jgi:type II secretory pathway component PulF